ncbi:hypothetical protein TWF694_000454 [Orbilia ellipsospora]|uniref:Uncharacterized protein n=1 Tax=Orbilia ellipsospora TaxID=2528407 RepID=A0AAV9XPI4_9PEZI
MPRPPRRTAATRRGEQKTTAAPIDTTTTTVTTGTKITIPSSPPVPRTRRTTRATKAASTLSNASEIDSIPSTHPLSNNNNNTSTQRDSSSASASVSHNTIRKATQAAAAASNTNTVSESIIEVSKTPSPDAQIRVGDMLSMSTPATRGKKRDSKTAFEEDFAASLLAAEASESENDMVEPYTPTKSSGGPQKKRISLGEKIEGSVLSLTGRSLKGKGVINPDDTIDFNYSSSPERSPAPKRFGFLQPLEDSESESDVEEEQHDNENRVEEVEDELPTPAPVRTRGKKKTITTDKTETEKTEKQPTTKSLQSLLPKRRAKPKPKASTKPKAKVTKEISKKEKSRSALVDVTKDILDEDELQAIDAPPKPIFGAGMDILSDDELGREIYIDSSARSSSVGAPPTPPSPPRRAARGKGKGRAASEDPQLPRRQRRTYGKPRRQDSEVSNKENDTPARGLRTGGNASGKLKLGNRDGDVVLDKKEKKEVEEIRKKFREVDDWDLCFEEVTVPGSSDGVVRGGR